MDLEILHTEVKAPRKGAPCGMSRPACPHSFSRHTAIPLRRATMIVP
jgi:hypothetical protein